MRSTSLRHNVVVDRVRCLSMVFVLLTFASSVSAEDDGLRSKMNISGVYPHLTAYGIYSQDGAHLKPGHEECGIGAIVPWAGKLWMVNYAPHKPGGSEHKLFSIDSDLDMKVHPESVGGTPAGRMIHAESKQLLIAHYIISEDGTVRVIPIEKMPIRVTAITRHLKDPENMVYYVDMEGSIWEANVHTLAVTRLFKKPVPGWHGKGAYVSQGRLVISNNGELHAGSYDGLLVGGPATSDEERGVLAEFNGKDWSIIERKQYTDVTGPAGIAGGSDGNDPIWTMGWDRRSVRLKVLDQGQWHTYLLPKAAFCNDAYHGWYTEWPRIREITDGRWMMDMHGMFFDFPKTFSAANSAGIQPIGSHLRYIPDFCAWNGKLVLATDETSIQGNPLAGQPQTNLWFGDYEELKTWGPASGYGGPWIDDQVAANQPSDPFLVSGFDRRALHLAVGRKKADASDAITRATDQQRITSLPDAFVSLPRVTMKRGDWKQPASGYEFVVNEPVTVFLAVDKRGDTRLGSEWTLTEMAVAWGTGNNSDIVYQRSFPAGVITIPANTTEHLSGSFGMPHTAFVRGTSARLAIHSNTATVTIPKPLPKSSPIDMTPVLFTVEVDGKGTGQWTNHATIEVPADGYICHLFPSDFEATWLRLKTNRDCVATAILHQTTNRFVSGSDNESMFAGLADADEKAAQAAPVYPALVYPAKLNRDLSVIDRDGKQFEFTKEGFEFQSVKSDPKLAELLAVAPEFTVDDASVILMHHGKRLRLPKGSAAFDKAFAFGWPRGSREVESERHLANIHGTFYEVPLIINGQPPAFNLMRPVSSHQKQISDFCTWNGLLVLAGVSPQAKSDGHVFTNSSHQLGLWFGGIDDLWKFGKPVGQGGPWKSTSVKAGEASDAYLMTGYDKKTLTLRSDKDTTVMVEVDIDHQSGWHRYLSMDLKAGESRSHEFPEGFSAHWVRLFSSNDVTVTGQFVYE